MELGVQCHWPAAWPPGIFVQEAGWPQGPVWTGAENLAPQRGFDPRTSQLVASLCTDWAIPAHDGYVEVAETCSCDMQNICCVLDRISPCCIIWREEENSTLKLIMFELLTHVVWVHSDVSEEPVASTISVTKFSSSGFWRWKQQFAPKRNYNLNLWLAFFEVVTLINMVIMLLISDVSKERTAFFFKGWVILSENTKRRL